MKTKFSTQLTIFFSIFMILFVGGGSYLVYNYTAKIFTETTEDRFLNQAFHTMVKIKMFVINQHEDIENLAMTLAMVDREKTEEIKTRVAEFKKTHDINSIAYFDAHDLSGKLNLTGQGNTEKELAKKYLGSMAKKQDFDFFINADKSNLWQMYFVQSIKDRSGKTHGVIVATVSTKELDDILGQFEGIYKGNREISMDVLNSNGLIIYSNADKSKILKKTSQDWGNISDTFNKGQTFGVKRHIHEGIGDELHAFAVISDEDLFKTQHWIVLLHFPASIVYAPIIKIKNTLIVFVIGLLLIGLIAINYISWKLSRPLEKILNGADDIAKGNFDTYLNIADVKTYEINLLSTAINRIGEHLREYRQKTLDYSSELESRVNKRTEELNQTNNLLNEELNERKKTTIELTDKKRELETYNNTVTLLSEMSDGLQACQTFNEVYSMVAQYGNRLFPHNPGSILIHDENLGIFKLIAGWGEHPFGEQELKQGECMSLNCGTLYIATNNIHRYGSHCSFSQGIAKSHMCVPIADTGLLQLVINETDGIPEQKNLKFITTNVSNRLKIALTSLALKENLKNLAIRDRLTKLYNRGYMEEVFRRELITAGREKTQVGIIMLDIDHFKKINDTYGHAAGDVVLKEISDVMTGSLRTSDVCCRYGGEEFLMILPKIDLVNLIGKAEQIATKIRKTEIKTETLQLNNVTVSVGVALYPTHGTNISDLINMADTSLYQAKKTGRDKVCFPDFLGLRVQEV